MTTDEEVRNRTRIRELEKEVTDLRKAVFEKLELLKILPENTKKDPKLGAFFLTNQLTNNYNNTSLSCKVVIVSIIFFVILLFVFRENNIIID